MIEITAYKLTLKDMIEYERLSKTGSSSLEMQTFLLSRYYRIPLDDLQKIEYNVVCQMVTRLNKYMAKTEAEMNEELIEAEIKRATNNDEEIEDRFNILDL